MFSSISLHCSLKAFLSLLAILWISAFSWVYLSLSLCLPFSSSKYSICIKYLYRIYIYILYVQIIYCIYIHYYRLSLQNIRVYIYRCISKCIYICIIYVHLYLIQHLSASIQFSSVQSLSRVRLFATPRTAARQASLSITNSRSLLRLTSIETVMPSSHLILCHPLLLLPPIPPSSRVFSNESTLRMRWPKYWSFSFSTIPSKEIPRLISFRMDWLELLAVQGTLKNLLQHHSSKASILSHSAFFTVQLSHPYMTTGKP